MKAKDLYRVLESEVGPWLKERGFKKRRVSRLTLQRLVDGKYQSVWFQCDKYGWDSYAGGKFYVNFTVSESTDPEAGARQEARLNHFLTDAELERARKYRDEIVARIPKPPYSYFEDLQAAFSKSAGPESAGSLIQTVRDQFEPESIPYRRHQDFSLRYWQPGDIVGWSALIRAVLPRAIDEMQSWSLPPYGAKP